MTRKTLLSKGKLATLLLVVVAALTAACSAAGVATSGPAQAPNPGAFGVSDAAKGSAGNGTSPAQGIPGLATVTRDLVLTANISMRASDPWVVADSARSIAAGLGGDLLGLSQSGSGANRSATLTMRVPSIRFDDALSALKKLDGEVITSNVSAKDVTDQLVDLQARLTAMQAVEARYIQLLAAAKTVDEMLRVESTLTNTRVQIEQLQAQQKSLRDQVSYSTISLQVSSVPVTIVPTDPKPVWDPSKTFDRAVAALSVLLRTAADLAIWLFVLGWIPLLALAIALGATRLRATRVPTA